MNIFEKLKAAATENAQAKYLITHYNMDQCDHNLTTEEKFNLARKFESLIEKIRQLEELHSCENAASKKRILETHIIKQLKETPALMQIISLGKTTIADQTFKGYMLSDIAEACELNAVLMHMYNSNIAINAYDLDGNNLPMKAIKSGRASDARRMLYLDLNNAVDVDKTHTNNDHQNIGMYALDRLAIAINNEKNNKPEFLADYLGVIDDCLKDQTMSTYQHPKTLYNLGMSIHDACTDKRYLYLRDELLKLFDTALKRTSAIKQENKKGENMYEMAAQGPFKYQYGSLLKTPLYEQLLKERRQKDLDDYAKSLED